MSKTKLMNKMFAVLLVFTFVAGLVSTSIPQTAYAAEDTKIDVKKLIADIEDKDVKEAVSRLAAFEIIHGKEDGKYHPEDMVTREEFAKILVTSLKMDTAAKAGLGFTHFKDVEATRWSAGYIGIAAGHGLIKGYPDGTFKPANQVSYAEAITMLVRALGYKDEFLSGQWPANYLAKAGEKEITKKVKFTDAYGFANRGDVAIMVNNTLDAKVVKVVEYTAGAIKYEERDVTLLEDKLNIEKLEDVRVVANKRIDDGLKEDEVTLRIFSEKKKKDDFDDKDYTFVGNVNPELVLGEEVNAYLNDDDEVIYLEKKDSDKVYFDYVQKVILKDKKIEKLDLAKADDDYEFDENALIYYLDGDKYKVAKLDSDERIDLDRSIFEGKVGKFVIRNRKIIYAEVMDMGEAYPWMVVFENKDGLLKGICADDDEFEIDLTKDGNYDGVIILDSEGYELDVDDIEKGNLIYVQKQEYDGDDYAVVRVVKNNILEGKLDRVQDNKVKIGKEERKVVYFDNDGGRNFQAYYSVDGGDEIKQFNPKSSEFIDDMDDADEENMVAYTDAVGRIAYFVTEAEAASGYKYGIVTRVYADNDRIKVFTIADDGEDDEFVYKVEEEKNVTHARVLDKYGRKLSESDYKDSKNLRPLKEGSVIKFKLNKNGEIAEDKLYVMDPANLWKITTKNDFGKDYLPKAKMINPDPDNASEKDFGGAGIDFEETGSYVTFAVDDNVVIIDAENYKFKTNGDKDKIENIKEKYFADINNADDFAKGNWKDLSKANGIDSYFYVFCDDDKEVNAKAVIFLGRGSGSAANDEIAIYAIKKWYKAGDTYIDYVAYDENKTESRVVDNDNNTFFKNYGKEHPYIAKVKSNGKLEIITPGKSKDGFDIYFGKVAERKSDSIKLEGTYVVTGDDIYKNNSKAGSGDKLEKMFSISNKTVVYEEDSKKSTSNLAAGDVVLMVVEKETNARVIERLIDSEKTKILKVIGEEGSGETEPEVDKGVVTYINTAGKTFEVDGKYTYAIDEETRLVEDGETKAMGIVEILATLAKGDKVEVKDNVITRESTDDARAAKAVEEMFLALPKAEDVVYADKEDIEDATDAYAALTDAQKALVSNAAKDHANAAVAALDIILAMDVTGVGAKIGTNYYGELVLVNSKVSDVENIEISLYLGTTKQATITATAKVYEDFPDNKTIGGTFVAGDPYWTMAGTVGTGLNAPNLVVAKVTFASGMVVEVSSTTIYE